MSIPFSDFPEMFRIRQKFKDPKIDHLTDEVKTQLSRLNLKTKVRPGQTVAITAGSRVITGINHILKAIVDHFKELKTRPFIVPAMGSHGGGTAQGQRQIIESYGITESFCGCPILSSMETVVVCHSPEGFPVHFDKYAYDADHVVICNRVKPHTLLVGEIESGLMKMMLIGLGKQSGAKIYHQAFHDYSFNQILRSVVKEVVVRTSILAGVGIVENSYGQTAKIAAILPEKFENTEKTLLTQAKKWMPRLPFRKVDVLLIDEIGKNISGSGLDLNIVGRKHLWHASAENEFPKIRMIAIRNLTALTHGSAVGIGTVEFCHKRVLEKMDVNKTRINVLTGGYHMEAMIPLDYPTDYEMIQVMLSQIGLTQPADAKLLWIRNTLELAEIECSAAYLEEAYSHTDLEILSDSRPLPFDDNGDLDDQHMNPKKINC